jgi:putative oxidoreductase
MPEKVLHTARTPMQKFLRLEFIDRSPDVGLLLLRLWLGVSMVWLHGWGKLLGAFSGKLTFLDPIGIGQVPSLLLAIFAEVGCSVLLMLGLGTRWAALILAFTMGVAFFVVNGGAFAKGELAWAYLGSCLVLFVAGAGRFSMDQK